MYPVEAAKMAAILGETKSTYASEEPGRHHKPRPSASTIDSTITHPGSVKINVQGAFIVNEDSALANGSAEDGAHHETTDIRLPNHTAVVSHVAVDVCRSWLSIATSNRRTYADLRVIDWGIPRQACLLLPRTGVCGTGG